MVIHSLSRQGKYHRLMNIENQDFIYSGENEKFCIISLADGVSSCRYAKEGAEIACKILTEIFLRDGDFFLTHDVSKYNQDFSRLIISNILYEIEKKSVNNEYDTKEYSSTISGVLFDKIRQKLLCFSVGDSMIIAKKEDEYQILLRPYQNENGCCVTTTIGAEKIANIRIFDARSIASVIIFSDGAWKKIFNEKKFALLNTYTELNNYLDSSYCIDDYSYISITKEEFSNA